MLDTTYMFATKSNGKTQASCFKGEAALVDMGAALAAFLEQSLGIKEVVSEAIGDNIQNFFRLSCRYQDQKERSLLFLVCQDRDKEIQKLQADGQNRLVLGVDSIPFVALIKLIDNLVAKGDLNVYPDQPKDKNIDYSQAPQIIMAEMSSILKLGKLATNDAALVHILDDETNKYYKGDMDRAVLTSIENGLDLLQYAERPQEDSELKDMLIDIDNYRYSIGNYDGEGDRSFTDRVLDVNYLENSLLFSNDFLEAYNQETGKQFGFLVFEGTTHSEKEFVMCSYSNNGFTNKVAVAQSDNKNPLFNITNYVYDENLISSLADLHQSSPKVAASLLDMLFLFFFRDREKLIAEWVGDKDILVSKPYFMANVYKKTVTDQPGHCHYNGCVKAGYPVLNIKLNLGLQLGDSTTEILDIVMCKSRLYNNRDIIALIASVDQDEAFMDQPDIVFGKDNAVMLSGILKLLCAKMLGKYNFTQMNGYLEELLALAGYPKLNQADNHSLKYLAK